ncbi:MAG: DedA family protein [Candidatus Kapabacteria bacterium]|nr:DedA family protein [Candidatus Kapabacteria bacterium]MDW8011381.1 DedA family protein [Bacteroidota bacterium]
MEQWIAYLQELPPSGVLLFALAVTFLENVFPPSPSDVLLLFCGVLVGLGVVDFATLVVAATVGSVAGFSAMFWLGYLVGVRVIDVGRLRFVPLEAVQKVEQWFQRYGYWVILVNRFLSGTRAVISFVAGMSKLKFPLTLLLCTIGAFAWNALVVTLGWSVGQNWRAIAEVLQLFGTIVTLLVVGVVVGWFLWWRVRTKRSQQAMS